MAPLVDNYKAPVRRKTVDFRRLAGREACRRRAESRRRNNSIDSRDDQCPNNSAGTTSFDLLFSFDRLFSFFGSWRGFRLCVWPGIMSMFKGLTAMETADGE